MTLAIGLRSVNALLGGWLIVAIVVVVLNERRRGNRDRGQYFRFAGLALYAANAGLAIVDARNYPVTWHTWIAGVSAVVSAIGVLHIRRQQGVYKNRSGRI